MEREYKIYAILDCNVDDDLISLPHIGFPDTIYIHVGNVRIDDDITDEELKALINRIKAFRIRYDDYISIRRRYNPCTDTHFIFVDVNGKAVGYFHEEQNK